LIEIYDFSFMNTILFKSVITPFSLLLLMNVFLNEGNLNRSQIKVLHHKVTASADSGF